MKFLVLQWIRPETPLETLAKLTPAQFKYLDELESRGKIEKYYHLIGQQGHMIIVDVQSDEELSRIISEDPLFFQSSREIYPLTTRETHKKYLRKLLGIKIKRKAPSDDALFEALCVAYKKTGKPVSSRQISDTAGIEDPDFGRSVARAAMKRLMAEGKVEGLKPTEGRAALVYKPK